MVFNQLIRWLIHHLVEMHIFSVAALTPAKIIDTSHNVWWLKETSEKCELVSLDHEIPDMWKTKKHVPNMSKPPNQHTKLDIIRIFGE